MQYQHINRAMVSELFKFHYTRNNGNGLKLARNSVKTLGEVHHEVSVTRSVKFYVDIETIWKYQI